MMELWDVYENVDSDRRRNKTDSRTHRRQQNNGKAENCRGSRGLVLTAALLGLLCLFLLVAITRQHLVISWKLSSKNDEELNQNISDLRDSETRLKSDIKQLSEKNQELETKVKNVIDEKNREEKHLESLIQKNQDLETKLKNQADETDRALKSVESQKNQELEKNLGCLKNLKIRTCSLGLIFMSPESLNWSDSRQYCRNHGADLIIINSEEKQRKVSSLIQERIWIGLTDMEKEGEMKWVDDSPLVQGFWTRGEPNNSNGEHCVELVPSNPPLQNWNDFLCREKRKVICEK